MQNKIFIIMSLFFLTISYSQTNYKEVNDNIKSGSFSRAKQIINGIIANKEISGAERYDLLMQVDILERIEKDFKKRQNDILPQIQKYYPDADSAMLADWEKDGSLEMMLIDGEKRYFNNAAANLFRVNKEAKKKKIEIEGTPESKLNEFLSSFIPKAVSSTDKDGFSSPVKFNIKYTLSVDENSVPAGELIRAWLPFPREEHLRQKSVKLLNTSEPNYILADNASYPQRTIYMEKIAEAGKTTKFEIEFEYTGYSQINRINQADIKPYDTGSSLYKEYTSERKPHIVFTDELKSLSQKIVGTETDPYQKAKKIFQWISKEVPWASAREYSTIDSISSYCVAKGYGDCGIKALLFITLARYNGIPAKWQSGWMLHPGSVNLHDWAEAYFEGHGWIPVDVDFGMQNSADKEVEDFYFGGIDSYHMVVNDDYGKNLFPAKIYPRSETNDFQRGEVEWKGGNLYFDEWDYNIEVLRN